MVKKDSGIVIHGLHKNTKKTKLTYSKVCLWETADLEKCRQGLTLLSELTQLMPALLSGKPQVLYLATKCSLVLVATTFSTI